MLKLIRSAHPFLRLCLLIVCFCATISTVRRGWLAAETIPFEVYTLQHAAPEHAQRMLKELLGPIAAETQIVIDSGADQLLVRGSGEAQQITRQLLKELDQPRQSSAAKPLALPGAVVRSYACPATRIAACATIINERIREHGRVTVDQARGRIVVVAPPEVQEQVSRFVAAYVVSGATQSGVPGGAASQDAVEQTGELTDAGKRNRTVSAVVPIRVRKLDAIRNALAQLLGKRMESGAGGSFDFVERAGHRTSLTLDVSQSVVRLRGPVTTVSQLTSLLQWLDTAPQPTGRAVRFVPLRNVDPATLTRAIRVWRQTGSAARVPGTRRSATDQSGMAVIQPVEFQQTADEPGAGDSEPVAESAQAETEPGAATPRALRQPLSNVQIDALPDLDVLILRGLDGDVEELTRIIQELERIHEEASPEIEVYLLRHVQGEALTALMSRVLDELAGPLQGRISITPLIKPNGLLLIGWGEAVKAAKQLIAQLDQPVDPQTQMRVFTLKNAAAAQIQGTIQEFLNGRGGLGPNVSVTADPRTNSLIVYAAPRDLLEVARLVERLDTGQTDSVKRVRMIRLKNSLAADIAATLEAAIATARGGSAGQRAAALEMLMVDPSGEKLVRSGLLNDVQITPDSRTNTLFVFGPEDSLPLIEALITELDQNPAASAQIKVFQVINGDAGDLILVLRTLFPQAATSNVPQLATARDEPTLVPVRFSVDVRTNSIIATGAAGDLQIMEALLLRLDEASSSERQTRVYRLKNSPALDVNQAVNEFLRSERIVAQAAPGRLNPFAQIESEVVVVAEPVTNSLIISATPRYFDEVMELVESLDEQPAKVMIQVILAEVELDNFREFGVELGIQDSLLFDRSLLGDLVTTSVTTAASTAGGVVTTTADTIQAASLTPGFEFNNSSTGNSGSTQSISTSGTVAGQGLSHFSLGRVSSDLQYGGLVLSAGSENVSVLLRALNETRNIEILSRPQIMTLDNQPAFIQVGQRVPRIVGTNINQVGQVNSIELENVGLILGVTPRISPDGMVVMELDAEKSNLGPESDGIPISVSSDGGIIRSPRVNITTAQTTVSAASGETIIIGGLITSEDTSISRRVPWLSEVPLLGELFRFDGSASMRKELLIILTPQVIRDKSQSEHLKQMEMARMSWISQDVFDWLEPNAAYGLAGSIDDTDVPVIYPDRTPGLEWTNPPQPESPPTVESSVETAPSEDRLPDSAPANRSLPVETDTTEDSAQIRFPSDVRQADLRRTEPRRRFSFIPRWLRRSNH